MIQDTIGQNGHTDKPSLIPARFFPRSLSGYSPHPLVTARVLQKIGGYAHARL